MIIPVVQWKWIFFRSHEIKKAGCQRNLEVALVRLVTIDALGPRFLELVDVIIRLGVVDLALFLRPTYDA